MRKYSKDYHLNMTPSLNGEMLDCIDIINDNEELGITITRAEFIRLSIEHLIDHIQKDSSSYIVKRLLKETRYI